MLPVAFLAGLETAINGALALDPPTLERLARLDGKVIAMELRGIGITLFLAPHGGGLRLMGHYDGDPDTTLSGTPVAMLRMSTGEAGAGLFTGEVTIHGDTELGQNFKRILDRLEIDWEEHLSHLTGDIVAHQLGNVVRGLTGWGRRAAETLGRDAAEYLQEEVQQVPHPYEVEGFVAQVDTLRDDVERMEARVRRMRHALHEQD
jgi:ubiquinone biosynthesis protein UbiJ